jgi:hypothetical protein
MATELAANVGVVVTVTATIRTFSAPSKSRRSQ